MTQSRANTEVWDSIALALISVQVIFLIFNRQPLAKIGLHSAL